MLLSKSVLAVVPARSGSKGMPHKNLQKLAGTSLIGMAGKVLQECRWLDRRVISTDSQDYADEARKHGLDAPFLRPDHLSTDSAGAVETLQHAVVESERVDGCRYDIVLIVEPTSPLRIAADIQGATELLVNSGMDSVITVSPIDTKYHPMKLLAIEEGRLGFYLAQGTQIKARQQLQGNYCFRNGICYALTRSCLMEQSKLFTERTLPYLIDRPIANIDGPLDFAWAEFLLSRSGLAGGGA